MARAGPEPNTLYFLPLSSPERLHPAYCEPRQASTGWDVCTVTMNGHELSVSVVSSATLPSPPRQISAMRRPASSPPSGPHAAIDAAFAKRAVRDVDPQRVGVIDQSFNERRGLGVDARPRLLPRCGDFFPFVQRFPPC